MNNDVIHKICFEVECSSEETARALQHVIHHYTWPRIEKATEGMIRKLDPDRIYAINKIELDFGELFLYELEEVEFAESFRNQLEESILAWSRKEGNNHFVQTPPTDRISDIITTFLVEGDLPWWVNKKQVPHLPGLLLKIINDQPLWIETFLLNQSAGAKQRLWALLGKKDKLRFASLFAAGQKKSLGINDFNKLNALLQEPFESANLADKEDNKILFKRAFQKYKGYLPEAVAWKLWIHILKKLENIILSKKDSKQDTAELEKLVGDWLKEEGTFDHALVQSLVKAFKKTQRKRDFLIRELIKDTDLTAYHFFEWIFKQFEPGSKRSGVSNIMATTWLRTSRLLPSGQIGRMKEKKFFSPFIEYDVAIIKNKKWIKGSLNSLPLQSLQLLKAILEVKDEILQVFEERNEHIEDFNEDKEIVVENSGLCLLAVYLPILFKELQYVKADRFKTKSAMSRAIYLLHFLVYGSKKAPEYMLQLNKILCGWEIKSPLPPKIPMKKNERLEAEELLQSVIRNWKTLKNTSIEGLRTSFLERKGILTENEQYWTLKVEKKGIDVMLSSMNWSFNLVKLPWMKKPLQVEW